MDVGQNSFETPHKSVRLLDAPGHRDFIPNMISGAYQADVAVMVVNATRGEFEAGFDQGGQTREHAVLVRSLGVSQLIVAVNKLDTVDWSQERFDLIVEKLKHFLKSSVGYRDSDVNYIPVSGLTGENLTLKTGVMEWYTGPTLVEAIDKLKPPARLIEKPFRMAASDVFKPNTGSGLAVAGRIESGFVMANDKVLVQPLNEIATVKTIESAEGVPIMEGISFAGEHVSLILASIDATAAVSAGSIVVDPTSPLPVTKHFRAKVSFHSKRIMSFCKKYFENVPSNGNVCFDFTDFTLMMTIEFSREKLQNILQFLYRLWCLTLMCPSPKAIPVFCTMVVCK